MWLLPFQSETHADHVSACLHPQKVSDSVNLLLTIMLTMLLPFFTVRKYVTVSLCCPPVCWPCHWLFPPSVGMWQSPSAAHHHPDHVTACFPPSGCMWQYLSAAHHSCWSWHWLLPLSVSMWQSRSAAHHHPDHVTAYFHPQIVCDNLHLLPTIILTMSLHVSTLRKYVTVSIYCTPSCWPCYYLFPPSGCRSHSQSLPIIMLTMSLAVSTQMVHDSLHLLPTIMLTMSLPVSTLRLYVIVSICCPPSWPCHCMFPPSDCMWQSPSPVHHHPDHVTACFPPSGSMWQSPSAAHHHADHITACFHPQDVCDTLNLCPSSCWPCHRLFPPSVGMWQSPSAAHHHPDHVTACFHPQLVCDSLHLLPTIILTMSLPVSTLSWYVTVSICCPPSSWPCHCLFSTLRQYVTASISVYHHANHVTACFHFQYVCDGLNLCPSLCWPCHCLFSTFREYVTVSICCPPSSWLCHCMFLPSESMWQSPCAAHHHADHVTTCFHPQRVCDSPSTAYHHADHVTACFHP